MSAWRRGWRTAAIGHIDRQPVEREVPGGVTGCIENPYLETGIGEFSSSPIPSPQIGGTAQQIGLF